MEVLKDADKFGKTVGAARGSMDPPYDKKVHFARLIGTSLPTLRRMEKGAIGTIGTTAEERRQLAERIVKKSGALPEWFGLNELESSDQDRLEKTETALAELQESSLAQFGTLDEVQRSLGRLQKRVERLERGEEEEEM